MSALGKIMDMPSVPVSLTALVTSGRLPPRLAALFTPTGGLADETWWAHVVRAADEYLAGEDVDEDVRGGVALAGAYGILDELEDCPDADQIDEDIRRVAELLQDAEDHGVDEDETLELWWYSEHLTSLAAEFRERDEELEAYIAEHGTTPKGRLEAKLEQAHELYESGDRAAAVALFREVAEVCPWDSEFSGCLDRIDVGWCRLLHDAAHTDGPEATRTIWQEARTHFRAARFPVAEHSWPLVDMLLGTGVPDIIEVIIYEWIEAAERAGTSDVPVSEEEHHLFQLAMAEIEEAANGG